MQLWGFQVEGVGFPPNFQRTLAAKLCVKPRNVFSRWKNVLEVLYHHAKFGGARISPAAGVAKNVEFFCVFVCLSVCPSGFWTSEFVRPISPWRRWSTETILMPLGRGRLVVVHPCSTLSDCCQLATTLNAEVQKIAKIGKNWGFFAPEDDRINRSRRNWACKRRPWVCNSTPNLALIGKRASIQEPPKMSKFAQKCSFWPPITP